MFLIRAKTVRETMIMSKAGDLHSSFRRTPLIPIRAAV